MANLTQAHKELFKRQDDEIFESFDDLYSHCEQQRERSRDIWKVPRELEFTSTADTLSVGMGSDGSFLMNHWSFQQFCRLCQVNRETVTRLSPTTAQSVLSETLPHGGDKPMQFLAENDIIRSLHGASYGRLWNVEVLDIVREFTDSFVPPQKAAIGRGTGLYSGPEDMFCFLINPTGWVEIEDQAFAPGLFLWNSEVGRRSVGLSTFWFQKVCQNHIVWDATDVVEIKRKHTANVRDSLHEMRDGIQRLVAAADSRKDAFYSALKKAMTTRLGDDADEVMQQLQKHGIPRNAATVAIEKAEQQGGFTIFALVDALTHFWSQNIRYAGKRFEADQKAASLLNLVVA